MDKLHNETIGPIHIEFWLKSGYAVGKSCFHRQCHFWTLEKETLRLYEAMNGEMVHVDTYNGVCRVVREEFDGAERIKP